MEVKRPESIKEILRVAEEYNELYHLPRPGNNTEFRAYYRGQENFLWTIQPSICRANGSMDERTAFDDIKTELESKETLFDKIAYIQHYVTGTRFIDFSSSLDIALFFACKDTSTTGKDGAVYIWSYDPHVSNWIDTTIMMEIICMEHDGYISIKEFSDILRNRYGERITSTYSRPALLDLALMGYLDYGFMVVPSDYKDNERMRRQKGAFLSADWNLRHRLNPLIDMKTMQARTYFLLIQYLCRKI